MANIIRAHSAPTRRIDGGIYQARLESERILGEARTASRELCAAAEVEAAAIRDAARSQGRAEGLADASEMLAWAAAERDRLLGSIEPEVVRLAIGIAAKLLGREAEHGSLARDMAARALAEARERTFVAVRVHPLDMVVVREHDAELSALVPRTSGIAWVADPAVGRGGAVVETETGSIDARLETQLEVVSRLLARVRP